LKVQCAASRTPVKQALTKLPRRLSGVEMPRRMRLDNGVGTRT
jgi:hypothetical protein